MYCGLSNVIYNFKIMFWFGAYIFVKKFLFIFHFIVIIIILLSCMRDHPGTLHDTGVQPGGSNVWTFYSKAVFYFSTPVYKSSWGEMSTLVKTRTVICVCLQRKHTPAHSGPKDVFLSDKS